MCVGNLVTVVEEADFAAVAARRANFDARLFALGKHEGGGLNHGPTFESDGRARVRTGGLDVARKK